MLTDLFDRVGIRINVRKMVSMVCQTYQSVGGNSDESYKIQMAGVGMSTILANANALGYQSATWN